MLVQTTIKSQSLGQSPEKSEYWTYSLGFFFPLHVELGVSFQSYHAGSSGEGDYNEKTIFLPGKWLVSCLLSGSEAYQLLPGFLTKETVHVLLLIQFVCGGKKVSGLLILSSC